MRSICVLALLLCVVTAAAADAAPAARPNVVYLLADDLGWGDLGCYGVPDIATPRIDRLAREGVRFTSFYANGPECTPTRAALLTGRYQQRVGGLECAIGIGGVGRYDDAIRLAAQHELGLPAAEGTISQALRQAGYATALAGKWHLGYETKFAPGVQGFQHALYCIGGGMDYFHHVEEPPAALPALRLNGQPLTRKGYFTEVIADEAVAWLQGPGAATGGRPFFLYVPFTAPHSPFQAPDEEEPQPLPAGSERWVQSKAPPRVYAAMIESLDRATGRILDALQMLGVADNTLVIFASDNGGTASARPCGLRGIKGTTFEGGIRVPCIVRWPGVLRAGLEYTHPAATFDLTASIARAAAVTPTRPLDGVDILADVAAGRAPQRDLFWRQRRGERTWRAVREGSLKLVLETKGPKTTEYLFDLAVDPGEKENLLASRPTDVARLSAKLAAWEKAVAPTR